MSHVDFKICQCHISLSFISPHNYDISDLVKAHVTHCYLFKPLSHTTKSYVALSNIKKRPCRHGDFRVNTHVYM